MPAQPSVQCFSHLLQDIRHQLFYSHGYALQFHGVARRLGLSSHPSVGNNLVIVLVAMGNIFVARKIYDTLLHDNHLSWNALISGYVKCKKPLDAIKLFYQKLEQEQEQREGEGNNIHHQHFTSYLFVSLLKACSDLKDAKICGDIHAKIDSIGLFQNNPFVGSALIHMYAKCGLLCKAIQVFDVVNVRDVVIWTTLIDGYVENGYGDEALSSYHQMCIEGIAPNASTLICILKACITSGNLRKGVDLHTQIKELGFSETKPHLGSTLVDMYSKVGSLDYAKKVFDELQVQDIVSWTSLISGYAEHGHVNEALECFERMQREGIPPNATTFVCVLKACSNIGDTNQVQGIHVEVERKGLLEENPILGITLINAYVKCGVLSCAEEVFDKLPNQDVISWTVLIGGYVEHGHVKDALRCFDEMTLKGVIPNSTTFVCILKACGSIVNAVRGQQICAEIEIQGLQQQRFVGSAMVDMLAKCRLFTLAQQVFERIQYQDVVAWTSLIVGYGEHGYGEEALMCMEQMELENVHPNAATFICGLKACGQIRALDKGYEIHAEIERQGLTQRDLTVCNALVDMYAKCGFIGIAQKLVDKLQIRNVVSWTTLIAAYVEHDYFDEAIECFDKMQFEGFRPNNATFDCVLKICSGIGAIGKGQEIHAEIERQGLLERDLEIGNTVVDTYAKFGMLGKAYEVFERLQHKNTASWNALLAGYIEQGKIEEAMRCFRCMELGRIVLDEITLVYALKLCSITRDVEKGREIHAQCVEREDSMERENLVGSSLVDMYGKCGFLTSSAHVFDGLSNRDIVSWTALITGYSEHGHNEEALKCFVQMQAEGVFPNAVTIHCVLKICSTLQAIKKGQEIHTMIEGNKLLLDHFVCSMLVDMYARCGSLATAQKAFDKLRDRHVVSWTTLLTGYEEHGYGKEAIHCFRQMIVEGVSLNVVTFIGCLKACGSIGASDVGIEIHAEIEKRGLLDMDDLGNTLVTMYAKCGSLCASQRVFESLPVRGLVSWNALITGYSKVGSTKDVFLHFYRMMAEHIEPDSITFLIILSACNRAGILNESWTYFESMRKHFGISPHIEHHTCVVDTYGRAGQLDKVISMMKEMPFDPDSAVYHTLLGFSRQWGHVILGEQAFDCALVS